MKIESIAHILNLHGIPYFIIGGRIYADSMISGTATFEIVEDLTDYTRSKVYAWLGY